MRALVVLVMALGLVQCDRPLPDAYPNSPPPDMPTVDPESELDEVPLDPAPKSPPIPLVLGHRGIGWNVTGNPYPENTHLSVQAALAAGADGVEVDLVKSADDVFILRHDNRLSTRSPNDGRPRSDCRGHITDQTWAHLETCLAHPYGEDGFRVPLDRLEFILDLPIGLLVLDLKNDQFDIEPVRSLTVLAEVLDEDSPQVMLMLYQPETVRIAQEMGFEACLKQHQSVANEPDFAEDVARLGAVAVCMHEPVTSRQTVRELHDEDIDVISYYLSSTPSTRFDRRVSELAQWGVSAIITDLVERSRNVLEPIGP